MATATPISDPIKVRTAGALRAGIAACAEAYRAKTRGTFVTSFTHGPVIEKELAIGTCDADIVGLTRDAIDTAHRLGALASRAVPVGSIQIGMAVRKGARRPDMGDMAAFEEALLAADALIYTTAPSGDYMASVFEKMGLADQLASKGERFDTGAKVNDRLIAGTAPLEIAFGVATELLAHNDGGVIYLGPLPREIEHPTPYAFAAVAGRDNDEVKAVLDFLATPVARELFAATGVD
jgi:molybdate transport system substrate-binding protein